MRMAEQQERAGATAPRRALKASLLPALAILGAASLSGCDSSGDDQMLFDGQSFRMKANDIDNDVERFTVEVRPVSASIEGAREAGRYEATRYCIENFGSSDIDWVFGPDDEVTRLQITDDRLILQGACKF